MTGSAEDHDNVRPAGAVAVPFMFTDLAADCFPFTIEFLDPATREVVWERRDIPGPGAIAIPSARSLGVEQVAVRMTFANGEVVVSDETGGDGR